MDKVIPTLTFVIFAVILTGCKNRKSDSIIYHTIGRKIEMSMCKNDSAQFTIFRYIDNPSCTSCQLKLGEWKIYHRILNKKFDNKVNLCFLCETKNVEEAKSLFNMYGFGSVAVVDSFINFYKTNNLSPTLGKDVVFLLDSSNTILSIGNPNENLKIDSLFTSIILGRFSKNQ